MEDKFLNNITNIIKCNNIKIIEYKRRLIEVEIATDYFTKSFLIGETLDTISGGQKGLTLYEDLYGLKIFKTDFSFVNFQFSYVLRLTNGEEILIYSDKQETKILE